jgi:hypothetical protein
VDDVYEFKDIPAQRHNVGGHYVLRNLEIVIFRRELHLFDNDTNVQY